MNTWPHGSQGNHGAPGHESTPGMRGLLGTPGNNDTYLHVHMRIMALTATATTSSRTFVCNTYGMVKPLVVIQAPNKLNIK